VDTGENQPMREREAATKIMMRLPDPFLDLVRVEASKIFLFSFLFKQIPKNFKTFCAWT
jgi:hypothetical protein